MQPNRESLWTLNFKGIVQLYTRGPVLPDAKTCGAALSRPLNIHEEVSDATGTLNKPVCLKVSTAPQACGCECVRTGVFERIHGTPSLMAV